MKYKFFVKTLGCKVNHYDSNQLIAKLISNGFSLNEDSPDLVIINSCAVTQTAISKSRYFVNYYRKQFPKSKIVLFGCWSETHKVRNDKIDLISGTGNLEELKNNILKLFNVEKNNSGEGEEINREEKEKKENKKKEGNEDKFFFNDRHRYFLKIQDGCNQFCSYCIIPYSRGRLKSRGEEGIIEEVLLAKERGYREIILTGIHLGLYGVDLKGDFSLAKLLEKLVKENKEVRFRLSSIEITEVTDELIDLMYKNDNTCPHLHISLQSGSDKILKLMNRPYTSKYFLDRVKILRKKIPNISISTDVIVGFPGETEDDFLDTYNFCKEVQFSKIHVFSFSLHKKTKAYTFPNRVDSLSIKKRSKRLRDLSSELEKEYEHKVMNEEKEKVEIIAENVVNGYVYGHSQYYFPLKIKKNEKLKDEDVLNNRFLIEDLK